MPYTSSYRILDKTGKVNYESKNNACFASLRDYFDKTSGTKIVVFRERKDIPLTLLKIKKYVDLLNEIGLFKIEYVYDVKTKECRFTIDTKDYKSISTFVGVTTVIRYLWEKQDRDKFTDIPKYFVALHKKYPKEDMLYKLMWAHTYLFKKEFRAFNSNHTLCVQDSYPIKLKDFREGSMMNSSFTGSKKDYNRPNISDYYDELDKLN